MNSRIILGPLFGCIGLLLSGFTSVDSSLPIQDTQAEEQAGTALHDLYANDDRLKAEGHETHEYRRKDDASGNELYNSYTLASKIFSEEEMSRMSHAYFDERHRLLYMLGYTSNILSSRSSYCEEHIYQRDDTDHTCRLCYYKSNSAPYKNGYYIATRYLFETSDLQFDEEDRLLSLLTYRREVGSDPYGYSEELFFSSGYQAEYEDGQLTAELQYYDFWGTNEVGAWEYRIYQYDEQGNCILNVVTTENEILLHCYEYPKDKNQIEEYTYLVKDDWELPCEDGSVYHLCPQWGKPAIQKTAADGTVEMELFYGQAMDLGQQHYLIPEDVEASLDDHIYIVQPDDSLWKIAYRFYGYGAYYDLIFRMNQSVIGGESNLIMPGMRLYLPEAGNAEDTNLFN